MAGDERSVEMLVGAVALEHQTGRSRGTVTWLTGLDLDVSLSENHLLRVVEVLPDQSHGDAIAHLKRMGDSYQIEALQEQAVWVNGVPVTSQLLLHGDMIEFGDVGPLSRYCLHCDEDPLRKSAGDIFVDSWTYLRVSRQPFLNRLYRAARSVMRRLTRETTIMFRLGILFSLLALSVLAYQQYQLNVLLEARLEKGFSRLDSFAGALARARKEALTPGDLTELRQDVARRLVLNAERLAALERRSEATARIVSEAIPSVLFLQGAYGFREKSSGKMLRQMVDENKRVRLLPNGQPLIGLDGNGPIAERQYTGTGFAVGDGKTLVTNRHVALPWENDAAVAALAAQGLEPVMIKFLAYLPGEAKSIAVQLVKASSEADLAVLKQTGEYKPIKGLTLGIAPPNPGDEVIVMGYPTGLRSMLAQSGEAFVAELQKSGDTEFWSVGSRLAAKGFVAPLASRGIVGQATKATIVYDAETTHGGSGGPVLDAEGRVVAVNAAILPEYGGSNLGVPVSKVHTLLEKIRN